MVARQRPCALSLPLHLKVLVAPIAGMLAGALEITSLWPMEWAKVQTQLNKGMPGWSLMGDVRRVGLGLYKGLPAMLVGVPLHEQRLLDVGCGTGSFLELVSPHFAQVRATLAKLFHVITALQLCGVEYNEGMIEQSAMRFIEASPHKVHGIDTIHG